MAAMMLVAHASTRPAKPCAARPLRSFCTATQIVFDHAPTDLPFGAAAEQHAVRHHGAYGATGTQHPEHVLYKHQIGLLAGLGAHAVREPFRERDVGSAVVLRERRVAE